MVKLSSSHTTSQLLKLTRQCRVITRASPQPMLMVIGPLYTFACVNSVCCDLLHQPEKDFLGKPFAEMMPEAADCVRQLDRVYKTGRAIVSRPEKSFQLELRQWAYSIWPLHINNKIVGTIIQLAELDRHQQQTVELNGALIVSSVRQHELTEAAERLTQLLHEEVAERSRLMEALRASEEGFRLILASVKDYAILLLDVDGNVANWNAGAERFKGYKAHEIIGKHFSVFYPKEARDAGTPDAELRIVRAVGRFEEEGWRVRSDGSPYWASVIISAVRDETGTLRGFSKVTRDITVRKNMEDALHEAHVLLASRAKQLERAVVLRTSELLATNEQLEAFVYSIAHDLRAPLRAMQGFSSLLVDEAGPSLSETCQGYANRINKSAQFMDALLIGLLTFSRISQAQVTLVPVNLGSVVELLLSRLEKDIRDTHATVESSGPWPVVLAHEATVAQVFFNLMSNALKFVKRGVAPEIRLISEERLDFIRIWIEDRGVGVAPENREQVFRLFNRLEGEKYPGTGIGLAIVQKGVERMGGRVGVETTPGGGSRFWFELKKA